MAGPLRVQGGVEARPLRLARPAAQIPRTASEETIYGTALTVGYEAIKFHQLYPEGEV